MTESDLLAAYRNGCGLRNAVFEDATLPGLSVPGIKGTGLNFRSSDLRHANLSGAVVRMCVFDNAQAANACFDGARLEDSTAVGADFSHAAFRNAHLTETSFSRALRDAILDNAEGDGVDFRGADLGSASLKSVRFDEADFRGADLRNADLSGGRFHSADFRGALLEGARFESTDCSGATFDKGEAPPPPSSSAEQSPNAAVLEYLNEFLALLPGAISGTEPAENMNRVQELIDGLVVSAGYSAEQREAVHRYLDSLTQPGGFDTQRLQQLLASLDSDSADPPGDLKAWIEPFLKNIRNDREV